MIKKLQRLIEREGTTQAALERKLGLSENRISKWANGKGEPTAAQALRLARHFGLSIESLVDDEIDELSEHARWTAIVAAHFWSDARARRI